VPERKGQPPSAGGEAGLPEATAALAFPAEFPIKVLGRRSRGFAQSVLEIVRAHAPDFEPRTMQMRASRQGTWLSLTVVVNATSREQLDALYRDLCDHPDVVMVL
jgi:putative lipoic acid-binding regulatory protein